MQFSVTVNDEITDGLRQIAGRMRDAAPVMLVIGQLIVSRAKRAFTDASLRPKPWDALSAKTLAARAQKKRKGTGPLIDSGMLARSPRVITHSAVHVTVGSDRRAGGYGLAAIHQFGAPRAQIPARPFFPLLGDSAETADLMPEVTAEIQKLIERHILGP